MSEAFFGEIRLFGFPWNPSEWALCDGRILPIQQYSALWSVIGNLYGGDRQNNKFALPDLRNAVVMHPNGGGALPQYELGKRYGADTVTLRAEELPSHTHSLSRKGAVNAITGKTSAPNANSNIGSVTKIINAGAGTNEAVPNLIPAGTPNTSLSGLSVSPAGFGGAHENRQPFLALNYCICLYGVYPARP